MQENWKRGTEEFETCYADSRDPNIIHVVLKAKDNGSGRNDVRLHFQKSRKDLTEIFSREVKPGQLKVINEESLAEAA